VVEDHRCKEYRRDKQQQRMGVQRVKEQELCGERNSDQAERQKVSHPHRVSWRYDDQAKQQSFHLR
jgi:hypothetical protein